MRTVTFGLVVLISLLESIAAAQPGRGKRLGKSLDVKEAIDPAKRYWLGWEVDEALGKITFEVEAVTEGYVGFGISPSGSMAGADLFIAGVKNGEGYSGDYHAERNGWPTLDSHDDWTLLNATEAKGKTIIRFSRLLESCDEQDYPITKDTNRLVWSIGASDDLAQHVDRGTYSSNLLFPEQPFDPTVYSYFDTVVNTTMPAQDTTYWCTVHEGPFLSEKHHVVAFEPYLPNEESEIYTHHYILYNCFPPEEESAEEFFGKYIGGGGAECHEPSSVEHVPRQYCLQYLFVWAKGGKRMVFPDEIGYPMGEKSGEKQYFMLEVHYDNPRMQAGVTFETGVRTYYTPILKEHDAALMVVGHVTAHPLTVPPTASNFIVAGHCAPECTAQYVPSEGVTVFNVLLHSHLSGRKLKLRQFRNGEELPWIEADSHYDFNYQQNKPLTEWRKIMPGDHLIYECTYDSTWKNDGTIVIGGLSSREEMCEAFLWFYPRVGLDNCMSFYPLEQGFLDLGITAINITSSSGNFGEDIILEPVHMRGTYLDSVSFKVNWTEEFRATYQERRRFGRHEYYCTSQSDDSYHFGNITYPEVDTEYAPQDPCDEDGGSTTTVETTSEEATAPSGETTTVDSTSDTTSQTEESTPEGSTESGAVVVTPTSSFFYSSLIIISVMMVMKPLMTTQH